MLYSLFLLLLGVAFAFSAKWMADERSKEAGCAFAVFGLLFVMFSFPSLFFILLALLVGLTGALTGHSN
jgi:chromate transport protein ChrA